MKEQDKDSLGNYFMRMWLVSVERQACGMVILAGTGILGGSSGRRRSCYHLAPGKSHTKIAGSQGLPHPSVERRLTLGLLISPLSPGVSCSGLCPGTLHAACSQITYKYECSGGEALV